MNREKTLPRVSGSRVLGKMKLAGCNVVLPDPRSQGPQLVIASTLAMILKQQGFDATPFFDPLAVLEECDTAAPALIISDVFVPETTGIDTAIELQQRVPQCKMLLFSGHCSPRGLVTYLAKLNAERAFLAK